MSKPIQDLRRSESTKIQYSLLQVMNIYQLWCNFIIFEVMPRYSSIYTYVSAELCLRNVDTFFDRNILFCVKKQGTAQHTYFLR